ncbi:ABC-type spermidine/putrescine transport system, ATPase component [Hoeflea sp. IMCC20628]|uniref:ABC transporter ATP-binding protein n=1 Tax=Hoeflea sp. IMCC20628 TaxID=1620421 RepID=UPI00063ABA66|nr:ABC transporter ATP-binding protein [Hoeflea sp. IMCC20628]AKH99391.1 ABC-type spermidine/putrescine transport system, ATPase component [Hoeflea sp. IMCC20628]
MSVIGSNAASVEFRDVTKIYPNAKVAAVDSISLTVEQGKLVTLLGPSGCGKTTTLRMIAGLEMVSSGQILIGGEDVTKLPATDRDVSMVFQSYALFPHMSVRENVEYGLKFSGFPKKEVGERAMAGLQLVGLQDFGARLPSQLSGGQQQRVAVARALVLEPQVLLFDEPLSNLDAKLRRQVREDIRDIQTKLGLTVVYVTHDQEEALAVSDRIIVMNNAVIAQEGTPRDLYDAPINGFVADFIGEANLLDCEIESVANDKATTVLGPVRLDLPSRGMKPGAAKLAIRPGRLELVKAGTANALPARLTKVTYVGRHLECFAETAIGPVFAVCNDVDAPFAVGDDIALHFPERGTVLISG